MDLISTPNLISVFDVCDTICIPKPWLSRLDDAYITRTCPATDDSRSRAFSTYLDASSLASCYSRLPRLDRHQPRIVYCRHSFSDEMIFAYRTGGLNTIVLSATNLWHCYSPSEHQNTLENYLSYDSTTYELLKTEYSDKLFQEQSHDRYHKVVHYQMARIVLYPKSSW